MNCCSRNNDCGFLGGGCNWIWLVVIFFVFCGCGDGDDGFLSGLFEGCNFELLLIAALAYVVLCGCPGGR